MRKQTDVIINLTLCIQLKQFEARVLSIVHTSKEPKSQSCKNMPFHTHNYRAKLQ